jgi:hypothetical protein
MSNLATRRALIALAVAFAAAMPAHAIYKWVDEKGVTHFSEDPPPDGRKSQKIEPKVTPPSSDAKPMESWKQREQESRKSRIEKDQKDEYQKAKSQNNAAERQNRCLYSRRELHVLEKQIPVYSVNEKGDKTYLEDKDRPAQIAKWKQAIADYCD